MSKNRGDYVAARERFSENTKGTLRETERACLALVETEIEVAFSFLRLAEGETKAGNGEHAAELIAKAVATHNVVLQYVGNMRAEFEAEKRELCVEARKLFEAIRGAEERRRQSGFQILVTQEQAQEQARYTSNTLPSRDRKGVGWPRYT